MQTSISGKYLLAILMLVAFTTTGCSRAYYNVMEKFGKEKRDILVDRVSDARESQEEAKEQFRSALEEFRSVVSVDGGELAEKYDRLSRAYERSEKRAEEVGDRIDKIEDVAEALFDEWEDELDEYENSSLRRRSERKLDETRSQYEGLIRAMRRAEDRMEPVLEAFQDQVLYLKHNLNAAAIASLDEEYTQLEDDIDELIVEMESSIREADAFIQRMEGNETGERYG